MLDSVHFGSLRYQSYVFFLLIYRLIFYNLYLYSGSFWYIGIKKSRPFMSSAKGSGSLIEYRLF